MSTASRDAGRRRSATRWRPRPITWVILVVVTFVVLVTMALTIGMLNGIGPFQSTDEVNVKPASPYAEGLKLEFVGTPIVQLETFTTTTQVQGTPVVNTDTYRTVTVTVKLTNNVMQPPPLQGTPTPNAPTPAPEPAKVLNASVKVLFYDRPRTDSNKKIVGSGIGNFYSPDGLAPGDSAEIVVVGTDIGAFNEESGYEAFPDGLWTDKDPIKTPEPSSDRSVPLSVQALLPRHNPTP